MHTDLCSLACLRLARSGGEAAAKCGKSSCTTEAKNGARTEGDGTTSEGRLTDGRSVVD